MLRDSFDHHPEWWNLNRYNEIKFPQEIMEYLPGTRGRFGTISFFTSHEYRWPRPEPLDPANALQKLSGESFMMWNRAMDQSYMLCARDIMQLKYEMDRRAWEVDKYRHEVGKDKESLGNANLEVFRLRTELINSSRDHGKKNEELVSLRNQLETKKAMECIHEDGIFCDHSYWRGTITQNKQYKNWMAGLWVGSIIALIGGGWGTFALTFGVFAIPVAYAGIRLSKVWVDEEVHKKMKRIVASGEILDVAIRDIMAQNNLLD
jgi:hypothetical protein